MRLYNRLDKVKSHLRNMRMDEFKYRLGVLGLLVWCTKRTRT